MEGVHELLRDSGDFEFQLGHGKDGRNKISETYEEEADTESQKC